MSIPFFMDPLICPAHCLRHYLNVTATLRYNLPESEWIPDQLFIAVRKPHHAVVSSTIARWLKSTLLSAGVDTSVFSAHSTRGASSSKAAMSGVTMKNILDTAAAWTFQRFYLRVEDRMIEQEVQPHLDYATVILVASNSRCDMESEPSEVQSQNG